MEYLKFIPEGWENVSQAFSLEDLNIASLNGNIMQGKVVKCDSNYNLYLNLGNNDVSEFSDYSLNNVRTFNFTGDGTTKSFTIYNNDNALPILPNPPLFIGNMDTDIPYTIKTYYNPGNPTQLRALITFVEAPAVGDYTFKYIVRY